MTPALYDSLDSLAQGIEEMGHLSPDYWGKMMHKLPHARSVERVGWLRERLAGKTLLHVGCAGPLHSELRKVCTRVYGFDREAMPVADCYQIDLDCLTGPLPVCAGVDVVGCFEVLEHLGNPRFLLESIRDAYPTQPLIVTSPNAFSDAGRAWLAKGYEQVNEQHTFWPSWHTMAVLLGLARYTVQEFYYYNGKPPTAEGLCFVCAPAQEP